MYEGSLNRLEQIGECMEWLEQSQACGWSLAPHETKAKGKLELGSLGPICLLVIPQSTW